MAVARFVGRVHIRSASGAESGFGTGFMVSPRLLLTNNHVRRNAAEARFSEVEFDFQSDRFGRMLTVVTFGLEPDVFFLTDRGLDFTLVAVRPRSQTGIELKLYGWNRLLEDEGKAIEGNPLNIIQHPRGEPKQLAIRSNNLLDVLDNFAHYETDTEPGSSGSPVFNDLWEVIGLHHSGVPKTDATGNLLAKDGSIWHPGDPPNRLDWVANEGVRISQLVKHLKAQSLTGQKADLLNELLNLDPPHPFEAAALAEHEQQQTRMTPVMPNSTNANITRTISIPLEITISLGMPEGITGAIPTPQPIAQPTLSATPPLSPAFTEAISIDPNYATRKGYSAEIFGDGQSSAPLAQTKRDHEGQSCHQQKSHGRR